MYRIVDYGVLVSVPLVLVTGFVVATWTILWVLLLILAQWDVSPKDFTCYISLNRQSEYTDQNNSCGRHILYLNFLNKKVLELEPHSFTHLWSLKLSRLFTWGGYRFLLHLKCAFKLHRSKNAEDKAPAKIQLRPLHYFCILFKVLRISSPVLWTLNFLLMNVAPRKSSYSLLWPLHCFSSWVHTGLLFSFRIAG